MGNIQIKTTLFLLLIACFSNVQVGAGIGSWKIYRAYQNATIVAETPNLCFGVYDGSLLSYNPEDEEVVTYSSEDGLSDVNIEYMTYSSEEKTLILVYQNGNIDLFLGQNNVYNLPFIKDNIYIQDKTIYNLELIGDYAYLSTAFGIVVIDVKRKEIKETYRLGTKVVSLTQKDNYFYALTNDGIKRANISTNLLDRENWITLDLNYPGNFTNGKKIFFFQGQMIVGQTDAIYYMDSNGVFKQLWTGSVRAVDLINDQLVLNVYDRIYFYTEGFNRTQVLEMAYQIIPSRKRNGYWLAAGNKGIIQIEKETDYSIITDGIEINSPASNLNFSMTCTNNKLYIVGGAREADRFNNPGILMTLDLNNRRWSNLDASAIAEQTGVSCLDLMSVAVDPRDSEHYFVSSWGEGVYEFQNDEFIKLHTYNNSSLETANPSYKPATFVRVDGLVYDKSNNLWMVNGGVQNGLQCLTSEGEWKSYYYPALASADPNRIVIGSDNTLWFNLFRNRIGMVAIKGENYYHGTSFVDQQGKIIGASAYLCMAEDKNGTIWVGTDVGPISFSNAESIGRGNCYRVVSEDEYGSGYYLMENLKVTAIAVDGGNRKWIGTNNAGVYVVNQAAAGIEVINFTKENSQLISNTITSIVINDNSGEVFIGTDIGLCSYMSEAIEGKSDYSNVYAYPNPVYPSRNNQIVITGLVQNSTLKITDLGGNLIKEGQSMGGQFLWDCTDRTGAFVKAGTYLVFATTPSGSEGIVTTIMVIN